MPILVIPGDATLNGENYKETLLKADKKRCNLNELPVSLLTDVNQGHWDLYWPDGKKPPEAWYGLAEVEEDLQAHSPEEDVQKKAAVAIDFGTSSTVIAMRENGRCTLVRIGVEDLTKPVEASHFENPTILSMENLDRFMHAWHGQPYRPETNWRDAFCSHQAKAELAGRIEQSITELKSWARAEADSKPMAFRDGAKKTFHINPIRDLPGIEIENDFAEANFNPLELYAYFLGLFLNNQQINGGRIFTDYYLTFPVKFERQTRDRILASFRRGLIRSLPPSLIYSCDFDVNKVTVSEHANEPVAFAAAALPLLDNCMARDIARDADPEDVEVWDENYTAWSLASPADLYKMLTAHLAYFDEEYEALGRFLANNSSLKLPQVLKEKVEQLQRTYDRFGSESYQQFISYARKLCGDAEKLGQRYDWDQGREIRSNLPDAFANIRNIKKLRLFLENVIGSSIQDQFGRIQPTEEGISFGVFDFGGGTADFAIGLYRMATPEEEENEGWQEVIEIIDASGDINLGGENLVHAMAFEVVRANKEALQQGQVIPFVLPHDEQIFLGGDKIFSNSAIARANTYKLMQKLRPLWEGGNIEADGSDSGIENDDADYQIGLELVDENGNSCPDFKLNINKAKLRRLLKKRVEAGVDEFYHTMEQAFKNAGIEPSEFHILLAGNSCKSPLVEECLVEKGNAILGRGDRGSKDKIFVHPPKFPDISEPNAVTLKTGVAIGILNTLPGEPTGIIMRNAGQDEAPFPYTVGPLKQGRLEPKLNRNARYGEWVEFGKVPNSGMVIALYTLSPKGPMGEAQRSVDCKEDKIDFGKENAQKRIFVAPLTPNKIVFGIVEQDDSIISQIELKLES